MMRLPTLPHHQGTPRLHKLRQRQLQNQLGAPTVLKTRLLSPLKVAVQLAKCGKLSSKTHLYVWFLGFTRCSTQQALLAYFALQSFIRHKAMSPSFSPRCAGVGIEVGGVVIAAVGAVAVARHQPVEAGVPAGVVSLRWLSLFPPMQCTATQEGQESIEFHVMCKYSSGFWNT